MRKSNRTRSVALVAVLGSSLLLTACGARLTPEQRTDALAQTGGGAAGPAVPGAAEGMTTTDTAVDPGTTTDAAAGPAAAGPSTRIRTASTAPCALVVTTARTPPPKTPTVRTTFVPGR